MRRPAQISQQSDDPADFERDLIEIKLKFGDDAQVVFDQLAHRLERRATAKVVTPETYAERRERREAVVRPILTAKGLSVHRWEKDAGVASHVGQRYLNGETFPRPEQRRKLAKVIGLADLPD